MGICSRSDQCSSGHADYDHVIRDIADNYGASTDRDMSTYADHLPDAGANTNPAFVIYADCTCQPGAWTDVYALPKIQS